MRILLIGALVLAGWLGVGAYWYTCHIKCLCGDADPGQVQLADNEKPAASQPEKPKEGAEEVKKRSRAWSITGIDGAELMRFPASLRFSGGAAEPQFDPGSEAFPDSIYQYTLRNPEHFVELTGFLSQSEVDAGKGAELAAERAQALKDLLVANGVNADRITIASGENPGVAEANGDFLQGVSVKLMHMSQEMEKNVDQNIANKTLYCDFAAIEFQPDPSLVEYASELKNYLERHPGETVTLTGHTDDVGPGGANMWIGKKRARTVRDYFISQGIPKSKMKISTRGEHAPIASNDTEDGQAQNRRIEVVIQ